MKNTRILVVDDTKVVRDTVNLFLEIAGYDVLSATCGNDALQICKSQPIDLVITDMVMPGLSGIELIRQLTRYNPGVKIIAMSGGCNSNPENELSNALKEGAQAALQKPFFSEGLLSTVKTVLEKVDCPA
ncbi:response regulator [bacterium]|nr:response regulator [bacterium]